MHTQHLSFTFTAHGTASVHLHTLHSFRHPLTHTTTPDFLFYSSPASHHVTYLTSPYKLEPNKVLLFLLKIRYSTVIRVSRLFLTARPNKPNSRLTRPSPPANSPPPLATSRRRCLSVPPTTSSTQTDQPPTPVSACTPWPWPTP